MPHAASCDGLPQIARDALSELFERDDPTIVDVVLTGTRSLSEMIESWDSDLALLRGEDWLGHGHVRIGKELRRFRLPAMLSRWRRWRTWPRRSSSH